MITGDGGGNLVPMEKFKMMCQPLDFTYGDVITFGSIKTSCVTYMYVGSNIFDILRCSE